MAATTNTQLEDNFVYSPFAADVMRDPYPYYKVLRDKYPVYWLEQYDAWAISRYNDIQKLLSDPQAHLTTTEGTLMSPSMMRKRNSGVVPRAPLKPAGHLSQSAQSLLRTDSPIRNRSAAAQCRFPA